jgi:hypothetical protein
MGDVGVAERLAIVNAWNAGWSNERIVRIRKSFGADECEWGWEKACIARCFGSGTNSTIN